MFNWLKRLLGVAPVEPKQETLVLENPVVVETTAPAAAKATTAKPKTKTTKKAAPKKAPAKKAAPKKEAAPKVDLDSMKKSELLAHAKSVGAKANASMKKDEILAAIKNA